MKIALALLAACLSVSSALAKPRPDALTLLKNVTQKYADAKAYHIEAVQERISSNDFSHDWEKELLTAVVAADGKYRYEGKSGHGSAVLASDGKTRWAYHTDEHLYTQISASAAPTEKNHFISMEEMPVLEAKHLIMSITSLASQVQSATLLPDEKIEVNGRKVRCYVVHLAPNDFRTRKDLKTEETLWIDQASLAIVKRSLHQDSYTMLPPSGAHIPLQIEEKTVYTVVRLGQPEPSESFVFTPPADAELVESFPDPMMRKLPGDHAAEFVGKKAPEIQLKVADGKVTPLSTFRGKPVFIEFWATWCAPCMELMPELKRLYSETSKSVVWLSIDSDEDPNAAKAYLSQQHISWSNFHDADGSLGKAFQRNGIPLGVLIDREGKVAFYSTGYDIAELRAAFAKLSPEVSATTPAAGDSK